MLKSYRLMILGALLACGLFCAAGAKADPQSTDGRSGGVDSALYVPSGGTDASGTNRKALYSTTRALSTYDEDRDRDKILSGSAPLLTNTSLAIGAADSNATPLDVHTYSWLKLCIKGTPLAQGGNDTTSIVRLILQFRECLNNNTDSTSVFPEYGWNTTLGAAVSGADTTLSGHLVRGNAGSPWSGEYVIEFNAKRNAVTSSISVNGRLFYYPNGIAIPLDVLVGHRARFKYLQVRARNAGNITTASSSALAYDLYVLGFTQ